MEIYLIRHTSVDVPPGVCYGQTNVPLKTSFEQEAELVKQELAPHTFDSVYTSPLDRCVKLADYCGHTEALRDCRLKEIYMGDWEMQPFDQIKDARLQEWYDDYLHVPTLNGESYQDLLARVSGFLDHVKSSGDSKIAVFAHGGVILCAQIYAGVISENNAIKNLPSYGEVVRIVI